MTSYAEYKEYAYVWHKIIYMFDIFVHYFIIHTSQNTNTSADYDTEHTSYPVRNQASKGCTYCAGAYAKSQITVAVVCDNQLECETGFYFVFKC